MVMASKWRAPRVKQLSAAAKALLKKVERASVRGGAPGPAKELESSLLVHCASEHTEQGRHEKRLTSWSHWARQNGVRQVPSKQAPPGQSALLMHASQTPTP